MKLVEAMEIMIKNNFSEIPFKDLFKDTEITLVNKGKVGQLLEIYLGLSNSNTTLDFEDGELKTNKSLSPLGLPDQTMFITQVASEIDNLLGGSSFEESRIYKKINRLIYLPVVKIGEPKEWYFKTPIFFELNQRQSFFEQLENDYNQIVQKMHADIARSGRISTSSGEYIQIRTKDSQPYRGIYSNTYSCSVSNKNYAFYFKKKFMIDLLTSSIDYPEIN